MATRDGRPLKRLSLLLLLLAGCGPGSDDAAPPEIPAVGEGIDRGAYAVPVGAALALEPLAEDEEYRRAATRHFTSVTPENAMKWGEVQPERGEFDFRAADRLVEYAQQTGKRVRGHTLVWDRQLPGWLREGDWSKDELSEILRDHVTRVAEHFKGKVAEWDVVNEPLDSAGGWEDNIWHRVIGPAYVAIAFRAAREADPDARLFLNEIDAEQGPKSDALIEFARYMLEQGVPIDGIGLQNHLELGDAPSQERLETLGNTYGSLGLDVAITELDVAVGDAEDAEQRQAEVYRDVAQACAQLANCTGVTVWGIKDDWSWLGEEERPLPFDADGEPKPALDALLSPLRR